MTYTIPYSVRAVDPTTVDVGAVGWDTETRLIKMGALAPKIVCLTWATEPGQQWGDAPVGDIKARADGPDFAPMAQSLVNPYYSSVKVAHNASFDLAVLAAEWPDLLPYIFECLEKGLFRCTKIREKLLLLATTGDLSFRTKQGQKPKPVDYSLAGLVMHYFNEDITASKQGDDVWRLNYEALETTPSSEWPLEAVNYAKEDAVWALMILREQEKLRQHIIAERGIDPLIVQNERVMFDFCLHLISCHGVKIDHDEKQRVEKWLAEELETSQFVPLYDAGILRPAEPPRILKRGPRKGQMGDGVPESKSDKVIREYVLGLHEKFEKERPLIPTHPSVIAMGGSVLTPDPDWVNPIPLKYTDPSDRFPNGQLLVGSEFLEECSGLDKSHPDDISLLELLQHRQSLQKLVTTELPRMCVKDRDGNVVGEAEIVHPQFDSIKSTGRSSSMASKIIPSFNCQNVHPKVRACFMPRPGYLFCSIDYSYMELCTFAQACYSLFGFSALRDAINAGHDPHGWLGSMLAQQMDPQFAAWVTSNGGDAFAVFQGLKRGIDEVKAYHKHWRTFAKPVGLGFPGGLSYKTMMAVAKKQYGLVMTEEDAKRAKEAWLVALPEAPLYFEWIKQQTDPWNTNVRKFKDRETGEEIEKIEPAMAYFSPLGMHRAGADYCATANGFGLQTWSGDGFMSAVCAVVRSCFDASLGSSILLPKVRPVMPIHDEIISEVLDDGHAHEYASSVADIMVKAFSIVLPDVKIQAKPVLMRRWYKEAEQVFDQSGKLIPWEPKSDA